MTTTFFNLTGIKVSIFDINSTKLAPLLVLCFSKSLCNRSTLFIDEFLSDLSQLAIPVKSLKSYLLVIHTASFGFVTRSFFLFPVLESEGFPCFFQPFFPGTVWPEREIKEMFGVPIFNTVPNFEIDLRRLLTDYGFDGFPLQKGYPSVGFSELRYDPIMNRIVEEPLKLEQLPPIKKDFFSWTKTEQIGLTFVELNLANFDLPILV